MCPIVSPLSGSRSVGRVVSVALLAGIYLEAIALETPIHTDTARDLLLARDGLDFHIFEGCAAAFGSFVQGALWARLLGWTLTLAIGPAGQHAMVVMMLVASACLFDRMTRKHFGEDLGWAPVAMYLPLLSVAVGYPNLWNPTLTSLGTTLLTFSLLELVSGGATPAACASAASLALAAEGTWSALLATPVVVMATLVCCSHPLRALALAFLSGAIPSLAASYTTWAVNGGALLQAPWYLPMLAAALAAAIMLASRLRGRWQGLPLERRRRWLLAILVAVIVVQAVAASLLSRRLLVSPQYFLTALPALVISTSLAFRGLRRRATSPTARAAAIGAVPAILLSLPIGAAASWRLGLATGVPSMPTYSMREAAVLAAYFWRSGYSFPDVQRHLRGPDALELMTAIAAFAPGPDETPERPLADLRVLAFSERHRPAPGAPPGGDEVDLGFGRRAWILPLDGWVALAPSRVCFAPAEGDGTPSCTDVASDSIRYGGRYKDLSYPSLIRVHPTPNAPPGSTLKVTWELPVVVRGDDPERHLDLVGIVDLPWRIERVDGVGHRGELPARHVVLDRSGTSTGSVVLSTRVTPRRDYPPDFLETRPTEDDLRRSIDRLPPFGHYLCRFLDTCP